MVTVITVSYFQTPNIGILNEKIETLCFFQVLGKTHHSSKSKIKNGGLEKRKTGGWEKKKRNCELNVTSVLGMG